MAEQGGLARGRGRVASPQAARHPMLVSHVRTLRLNKVHFLEQLILFWLKE